MVKSICVKGSWIRVDLLENYTIKSEEKTYLRELAKKKLELASLPIMEERIKQWTLHNDLKGEKPMIWFEPWTIMDTGFLPQLKCESEVGKRIERQLVDSIFNYELIGDDTVITSDFKCYWNASILPFDMPIKKVSAGDSGGFHIENQISDLSEEMHLIKPAKMSFYKAMSMWWWDFVNDILGDILNVRMASNSFYCCLTNEIVHRMGMENMLVNMLTCSNEFHFMMNQISNDYISFFKTLEEQGMLCLNNGNDALAQGSFGFSSDLPLSNFKIDRIRTTDLWGFMDSQETVGISPEQYGEFIFPYYKKVIEHFGLFSYGCCEPTHPIWSDYLSKLSNLRKVSISPWCDEKYMGDQLKNSGVIYQRKPSPNYIGVETQLDETAFRKHIRNTLKSASGCKLEITFRDVYNLQGVFDKPKRAVEIVRQEIEENWV